jgi:hypothetical protein
MKRMWKPESSVLTSGEKCAGEDGQAYLRVSEMSLYVNRMLHTLRPWAAADSSIRAFGTLRSRAIDRLSR